MRALVYLPAAAVVAASAFWAYRVTYEAQDALERVSGLRADIVAEAETIAVLRAEWAYLSAPGRVRALLALHGAPLGLAPLRGAQFTQMRDLPWPPPETGWVTLDPALFQLFRDARR